MDLKGILKLIKLNEGTISMILGVVVVAVVGILVINYFRGLRSITQPQTSEQAANVTSSLPQEHSVATNENLWTIAEKYYGSGYNWVDIVRENKLANPNRLLVGQKLTIPKAEVRVIQAAPTAQAEDNVSTGTTAISGDTYTVVKGDHLWGISVRAYGDGYQWLKIAQTNNLANPNLIHPGNVLKLPR